LRVTLEKLTLESSGAGKGAAELLQMSEQQRQARRAEQKALINYQLADGSKGVIDCAALPSEELILRALFLADGQLLDPRTATLRPLADAREREEAQKTFQQNVKEESAKLEQILAVKRAAMPLIPKAGGANSDKAAESTPGQQQTDKPAA
jgi:hypothetical protein